MSLVDRQGDGGDGLLVQGDNLSVLAQLAPTHRGRVDLAYLDPPYATGSTFRTRVLVGRGDAPHPLVDDGLVSAVAYRDLWGGDRDRYLAAMRARIEAVHGLLADTGSLVLHADVSIGPYLKCVLDEVFGADAFRSAIAWHYYNKLGDRRKRALSSAFDTLYWYVKNPAAPFVFHRLEEPRDVPVRQLVRRKVGGRAVNARDEAGRLVYRERTTRMVDNVWRIRALQPAAKDEWVYFETQKPVDLLERVLAMTTDPGALVLDPFLGSGTTPVAAARLGRRFVGVDASPLAVHLTRKRLAADARRRGTPTPGVEVRWAPAEMPGPTATARFVDGRVQLVSFRSPTLERSLPAGALRDWHDAVDYWAVDWGPPGDAFHEAWRAFRTRRERAVPLEVVALPGVDPRSVRVRVFDALGLGSPATSPAQ